MKTYLRLIAIVACLVPFSAAAQWQWIDKEGRKVFSDLPPPSHIPERNILRSPNLQGGRASLPPQAAAELPEPKGKPQGVDPALQAKTKEKTDAEAAKRKQEEERIARMQADSCARAQRAMVGLNAGVRIAQTNEKGERVFLDEAGRAQEANRIQAIIEQDCK